MRLNNSLSLHIEIKPFIDLSNEYLPPLLLQPIIENAIWHGLAPSIREPKELHIRIDNIDHNLVIEISDNGIGIGAAYKEKVFELFQRLNPHLYEGTGVGLATCKKIVENYNGNIWLESEEGVGTTFYFSLAKSITVSMCKSIPIIIQKAS